MLRDVGKHRLDYVASEPRWSPSRSGTPMFGFRGMAEELSALTEVRRSFLQPLQPKYHKTFHDLGPHFFCIAEASSDAIWHTHLEILVFCAERRRIANVNSLAKYKHRKEWGRKKNCTVHDLGSETVKIDAVSQAWTHHVIRFADKHIDLIRGSNYPRCRDSQYKPPC